MNILFITEQFPFPLHDGGNLRTFHIIRALAQRHRVWLVSHAPQNDRVQAYATVGQHCEITTVRENPAVLRLFANSLQRVFWRHPLFILKNWSNDILAAADNLLSSESIDVIHYNMLDTACFDLAREWPQRKVFDTHNCLSAMAAGLAQHSHGLKRQLYERESRLLRYYERAVCERMDATLVCSADDAHQFQGASSNGNYVVVPNGVDTRHFTPCESRREQPLTLVFTGAMSYFPNEEAMVYFSTEILPRIKQHVPHVRTLIVGKQPSSQVRALHDGRSIIVTGPVLDIREYVEQAQVFVVPLRTGSGTRLKILEAFAMRKAVVSTSKGAEGIGARHGKEILIADDPDTFAAHVRTLLESPASREELTAAAHTLVTDQYEWASVSKKLLDVYDQLGDSKSENRLNIVANGVGMTLPTGGRLPNVRASN